MAEIPLIYRSIQQTVGALSPPRVQKKSPIQNTNGIPRGCISKVCQKLAKGEEAYTTLLLLPTGTTF